MMHGCAMIRKSMPMPIKPISYFLPRSMMLDLCTYVDHTRNHIFVKSDETPGAVHTFTKLTRWLGT